MVDNYDSFTFNVLHLFRRAGVEVEVRRNDEDFLTPVRQGRYRGALIGPGPGSPEDDAYFGNNRTLLAEACRLGLPVLGICLGFQGIFHFFGGRLRIGADPVHGKTSRLAITRPGGVLEGVPQGNRVMRYHSILADASTTPGELLLTSYAAGEGGEANLDEPMSLQHAALPIHGVQFHPESFATLNGARMAANFVAICRRGGASLP
jgi:anthranilate synthase component 2